MYKLRMIPIANDKASFSGAELASHCKPNTLRQYDQSVYTYLLPDSMAKDPPPGTRTQVGAL